MGVMGEMRFAGGKKVGIFFQALLAASSLYLFSGPFEPMRGVGGIDG